MSDSYERIESLSLDKRRLLELLLLEKQGAEEKNNQPALVRRNESSAPLSFSQQRLWFFDQLAPGNAVHHLSAVLRLKGSLNQQALQWCFDQIVSRHESLRTIFPNINGRPQQIVAAPRPALLTHYDLSNLPEPERETEALRLAAEQGQSPFELARGPLLRVCLLRLKADEHLLVFTMHHIISDGWSQGIIVRELSELYRAYLTDTKARLPELPVQYADFAAWERERLQGDTLDTGLAYWREALDGLVPLELPLDRPRPAVRGFLSASEKFELSVSLTEALRALSRREGVTLFMTLLAAFELLLARYSRQDDISVGSPIANRTSLEVEGIVGCFVNMLVLRTKLSGELSVRELLGRVREACLSAYAHADVPFERVVNELQPERNLDRNPLFQVAFALMNAPAPELELPGLTLCNVEMEQGLAENDLTLMLFEENQRLTGQLSYRRDLFDAATIRRMLTHWQRALELFVANADERLSELQLLSDAELEQMIVGWNETSASYDLKRCVHEIFERQATETPEALAVAGQGKQLSYGELNRRANQLAHYLRQLGTGPEARVAICLERSVEMVIAALGVLKAGGAYVPLDPSYPRERLAFMLKDSQSLVLLTRKELLGSLPLTAAQVVCIDSDWDAIALARDDEPQSGAAHDNLCYVIYTSGSTGRPNAVEVTHASLLNLVRWHQQRFKVSASDRATLVAAPAFDASVWELWPYLTMGASLHLPEDEIRLAPEQLRDWLLREQITLSFLPTPLAATLVRLGWPRRVPLRSLLTGGDKLQQGAPARLPFELVNNYGPTECTVVTTSCTISSGCHEDSPGRHEDIVPPIGRPISNMEVYLLDERMRPVPLGAVAEVWVGGAGLARGYLNRPELAAERFRPHPFSREVGERLYRTGDLGRFLPDGSLEYAGRVDEQVKVRGYRIELGEVEATLAQHPFVSEAVVMAREERQGSKLLTAYVVLRKETEADSDRLQEFLKERLPDYMVPRAFIFLAELPLTANGKYDRRALPAPELFGSQSHEAFIAPESHSEKLLAGIWSEVLRLERIGVDDNFFNLGGDSILSIEVVALARRAGLRISVQQLFRCQTIRELARAAEQLDTLSAVEIPATAPFSLISEQDRVRLPPDIVDAYPLIRMQSGMLFHSEYTDTSTFYHNLFTYHLRGPCDLEALRAVIAELLDRNAVLRTSFDLTSYSEPLQLVHREVPVPLVYEDLSNLPADGQESLIRAQNEADKRSRFELESAPLMRVRVQRRSAETYQFTLSFHHVILDGLSHVRLNVQLFNSFIARLQGAPESLPPPPAVTFRDYVGLEVEALRSEECRSYWTRKLEDSTITKLPRLSASRRAANDRRVRSLTVPLSDEQSDGLRRLAQREGVPLKSVLLAAHLRVMSFVGGQPDVVTGLVSNGRPETAGGERLLGLFLNTLPFRLQLNGGSWRELIRGTFEAEREALPFRRFPIAEIQHLHASGQPLFETCFNFTHYHFYQGIQETGQIEVLDSMGTAETNFTLLTNFSVDAVSSLIRLGFDYNPSELTGEQVETMAGYYVSTLDAMTRDPQARYELQSPLSSAERRRLLVEWNATAAPFPESAHLHEQFEARARQLPDAVALVADERRMSYGELNRRANRLAHFLQTLGTGPETQVGVLMHRTPEMIVSILAVLKAGGAYLPLDPAYPKERLSFMLENSRAPVLLTESRLVKTLPTHNARVVCPDTDAAKLDEYDDENPSVSLTPDKLAYVIYTSGSTGRPKGVGIQHRSAVAFLDWVKTVFSEDELKGVLFATSVCFDLSVFELFAPLSVGGKVILCENALRLPALSSRDEVTLVNLVPSALAELLRVDGLPPSVRTVNLAGEPLGLELVRAAYAKQHVERVYNLYGPSEDTTYSTGILLDKESPDAPPIGRPIANTEVYLLDRHLQPVPEGTPGNLYIGGAGLARGYLNESRLTAERFIPNPFSAEPGRRLYNTGDLARYLPDGNLAFLGRVDQQVKIRGFRIEPGEIEAVLNRHPRVEKAIVLTLAHGTGEKRLVAYVVMKEKGRAAVHDLQSYLAERLPAYMIPTAFVPLKKLPLTPNGKLDRAALPAPEATDGELLEDASTLPRNTLELRLMQIWEELLGVKSVGLRDNFFLDLGGHSILAVRLIALVEKQLGTRLSLSTLLQKATVEQLALALRREGDAVKQTPLILINPNGSRPPFVCVHPAMGRALCYVHLARHLGHDQPFYGLQSPGLEGEQPPLGSVEEMARHYIAALREVQPEGPYCLGGHSFGGIVAFEMAQQLVRAGQEVASLAILDTMAPQPKPDSALVPVETDDTQWLCEIAGIVERFLHKNLSMDYDKLKGLDFEEQLSILLDRFKEIDIFPQDAGKLQVRGLLEVEKANVRALGQYVPQFYPGKIALFRSAVLHREDFSSSYLHRFLDPALGWAALSAEPVELRIVPGDHITMITEPHVAGLAAQLRAHLDGRTMRAPAR